MNYKGISYYLRLFCFPISVLAFINILYSSYFDYFLSISSYIITLFLSLFIGLILFFTGKNSNRRINFIRATCINLIGLFQYIILIGDSFLS